MDTQKKEHPYNSTIFGLNDQFIQLSDEIYYVNLPNIVTHKSELILGNTYLLIIHETNELMADYVILESVLFDGFELLILMSTISGHAMKLTTDFNTCGDTSKWWLIDMDYIREGIRKGEALAI